MNTPLRRSGMARILKGSHSFTCTPRVHPLTEWTIPAFAFRAEAGTHLPTPEGWKAEFALGWCFSDTMWSAGITPLIACIVQCLFTWPSTQNMKWSRFRTLSLPSTVKRILVCERHFLVFSQVGMGQLSYICTAHPCTSTRPRPDSWLVCCPFRSTSRMTTWRPLPISALVWVRYFIEPDF